MLFPLRPHQQAALEGLRRFYVYALYRDVEMTDPFYIGKGSRDRLQSHEASSARDRAPTRRRSAIRKRIVELGYVPKQILYSDLTEDEAFALEIKLIAEIGRIDLGTGRLTNASNGGDGPSGAIISEDHRRRCSELNKGKPGPWRGKTMPEYIRQKMAEAQRGRTHTEETRAKMSASQSGQKHAMFGRKQSEESRAKISAGGKGRLVSAETKARMSAALRLRWQKKKAAEV